MTTADPTALPVTIPVEATVATPELLEVHVTSWFVAFDGLIDFDNWLLPFTANVIAAGATLTPLTETFALFTVTVALAVFAPSVVLTVITAVPTVFAVINPVLDTLATASLLEIHDTA